MLVYVITMIEEQDGELPIYEVYGACTSLPEFDLDEYEQDEDDTYRYRLKDTSNGVFTFSVSVQPLIDFEDYH